MTERENEPQDDPIATAILEALAVLPSGASLDPQDIAREVALERARPKDPPDLWRRYLAAVRQQAIHFGREGRIAVLRKSKPVDPRKPVKGVIRLRLPLKEEALPPESPEA